MFIFHLVALCFRIVRSFVRVWRIMVEKINFLNEKFTVRQLRHFPVDLPFPLGLCLRVPSVLKKCLLNPVPTH